MVHYNPCMPIYEYRCGSCDHTFEVLANFSDAPPTACEKCGAEAIEKVLHPVQINYKGSGFYSTDYGSGRSRGRGESAGSGGESGGSSGSSDGGSSSSSSGSGSGSSGSESSSSSSGSSDS